MNPHDQLIEKARRGGGAARGLDLHSEVQQVVRSQLQSMLGDAQRFVQVVEVLEGGRGDVLKAAARVGELATLPAMLAAEPQSRQVSAAPTLDEHNALVGDVHAIFAAVNALRAMLETRL